MQPNGFNGLTLVIISLMGIVTTFLTSLFWIAGLLLIVDAALMTQGLGLGFGDWIAEQLI